MVAEEFKTKVTAAIRNSAELSGAKVLKVRQVEDRCIVYVMSPAFTYDNGFRTHTLLREAVRAPGSPLTPDEQQSISLFRTFTPDQVKAIKRVRKRRKRTKEAETTIESYTQTHSLSVSEVRRLHEALAVWPPGEFERGLREELADILAARELAQLPPLTHEDCVRFRAFVNENRPFPSPDAPVQ